MPTCALRTLTIVAIQTMLLKNPRIARDEQHAAAFIQAAVSEGRFDAARQRQTAKQGEIIVDEQRKTTPRFNERILMLSPAHASSSSSTFACFKSAVSKPSVNQP